MNENGTYRCPECTETTLCPRYKIAVRAIDLDTEEQQNPTFAEFSFFGKQGEIITGQNVDLAVANAAGRVGYTPPEIEELPGRTFIVTVTPHHQSLDAEFFYFQVQATELPSNVPESSSSTPVSASATQLSPQHTPPESTQLEPQQDEKKNTTSQERKRPTTEDPSKNSKKKKGSIAKDLFPPEGTIEMKA